MAGARGTDKPESPEVTKAGGCKERTQLHRNIIHAYLPALETSDLQELKAWYEEYMGADANALNHRSPEVLKTQQDELDGLALEACIAALSASITVISGFCEDCQYLFDNWPDLSDPASKAEPLPEDLRFPGVGADWKHTIARDCHTLVLEAAGRKGCKMCAFLLQSLTDCDMVDTFRRIEVRMSQLGTMQTATLSVQNWGFGPSQLLWVGLPGQPGSSCNGGTAIYTVQISEPLSSFGKSVQMTLGALLIHQSQSLQRTDRCPLYSQVLDKVMLQTPQKMRERNTRRIADKVGFHRRRLLSPMYYQGLDEQTAIQYSQPSLGV